MVKYDAMKFHAILGDSIKPSFLTDYGACLLFLLLFFMLFSYKKFD